MRYIQKNKIAALELQNWKESPANDLGETNERYISAAIERYKREYDTDKQHSVAPIWDMLHSSPSQEGIGYSKAHLRASLLKEQGHICAYCGSRIRNNAHTKLDHVMPKALPQYTHLIFSYENIVAVCSGGPYLWHAIQEEDTLSSIAKKYYTTEQHIKNLNRNIRFEADKWTEIQTGQVPQYVEAGTGEYVLHTIQTGETLDFIAKKYATTEKKIQKLNRKLQFTVNETLKVAVQIAVASRFSHCDDKKKNNVHAIRPTDLDCQTKFIYLQNGTVQEKVKGDTDTERTISILGLNDSQFLKDKRIEIFTRIDEFVLEIMEEEPDKLGSALLQMKQDLYVNLEELPEMIFVTEYFLDSFLI